MMAPVIFETAGFDMCLAVGPAESHTITLVQFVQEYVAPFWLDDIIVDSNLILRHELIHIVMAAGRKVYIKHAMHKVPIDDPSRKAVLKLLPHSLVHFTSIRQFCPCWVSRLTSPARRRSFRSALSASTRAFSYGIPFAMSRCSTSRGSIRNCRSSGSAS